MLFAKPWLDALIVLLVVLLFFGPKRLPALGKSLGQGMREFKDSITGHSSDDDDEDERPALTEASASETTSASSAPSEPAQATAAPAAEPQSAKVASSEHGS
ncbi:MAG: twin-arginine translocase TatA/TatE family subunit [Solirubrobacteraceae bacterium]